MFQTQINPPAIVQFISGYEAEILQEFEASAAANPLDLVMDYMLKQINAIDAARKEIRVANPNFLPIL